MSLKMQETTTSSFVSFFKDIKILHSVFALPFAVATALRPDVVQHLSSVKAILILAALVSARSFAMGYNRYADREIDALNPRTRGRAIPSGSLSLGRMRWILLFFSVVFIVTSFLLSTLCGLLSPIVLMILAGYSFTKRFTVFCHFYLGLCLGLSPVATEIALTGRISLLSLYLGIGIVFWTAAFDIIYASADQDFDRAKGLFSVPSVFGHTGSGVICGVCYLVAVSFWSLYGTRVGYSSWFFGGLTLIASLFVGQVYIFVKGRANTPSRINLIFFWANATVSVVLLMSTLMERIN
jgi:4-hydroxybenzoate polyprenyltransferase